jgi:Pyruvate/2-oxoglutarate dehydrogenase complex, dihydrolipoamide acyltransferase (E2) component, and related enzymes
VGLVRVAVDPDYRYRFARVAGRMWHKGGEVVQKGDLTEEVRTSPLLQVTPIEADSSAVDEIFAGDVNATAAAVARAEALGVDLRQVVGTGLEGRVLVSDVEGYGD